jgi:DNA-binding response OmpR family regulator
LALKKFQIFQPDFVLLDIMLPKKSGWEILKELVEVNNNSSKIVMLTNLGEQDKIKQALEMGADDYLIKASLTPSELVEIIQDKM